MSNTKQRIGQFFVQIDGTDLSEEVIGLLDDAVVEEDLMQPAMFVLRFNDSRLELIDGKLFHLGAEVRLGAAEGNGKRKLLLVGEITSIEPTMEQHGITLLVRGYDRSHRLHRGTRTRTFLKQSDDTIIGQIAREHGLRLDIAPTNTRHDYVIQDNQTDMDFVRERAAKLGFCVFVEDRTLHIRPIEQSPPAAPEQEWGVSLLSFRTRLTAVAQPNEVDVRGWDGLAKMPIVGTASRAAQPSQIGDGRTGGKAAENAFNTSAKLVITDRLVDNQNEAKQIAQAILDQRSSAYLTAEGRCNGDPEIRAGRTIKIANIGTRLSGSYFITAVHHEYTPTNGYMTIFFASGHRPTSLLASLAPHPAPQRVSGVVTGVVTNVNDPEKLGRVRLAFRWLDDQHETDWVRVALPGAGPKRGFATLPEVDDEVLVSFEHGDLQRPYVLGGLWNSKDLPPADAIKQGKVEVRTLTTRAGHQITLSDEAGKGKIELKTSKHTITLDDSGSGKIAIKTGKHTLTLDDSGSGKIVLESGGDVELKSAAGGLKISAQGEIELKGASGKLSISASGIELNSSAMLKVNASAKLDLTSSGITTIQGSLVKIN